MLYLVIFEIDKYHIQFLEYNYVNVISDKRKITLSEIYSWILHHFPYYKGAGNGWKVRDLLHVTSHHVTLRHVTLRHATNPTWFLYVVFNFTNFHQLEERTMCRQIFERQVVLSALIYRLEANTIIYSSYASDNVHSACIICR